MIVFKKAWRRKKPSSKRSIFSNVEALKLAWFVMRCPTLADACAELRRVADTLPADEGRGWGSMMRMLAAGLEAGTAPFAIFTDGNMKLSFTSFSALPIVTCPGAGECAEWCYSKKAWRTPNGFLRQVQNTLLLRFRKRAVIDAWKAIPEGLVVRLYVDGDFDSMETLQFWFNLCNGRPDLSVYGYSKSWELFLDWHDQGRPFPANYGVNVSNGSKYGPELEQRMLELSVARERFVAVEIDPKFFRKEKGYDRYADPAYHRAVREAAMRMGYGKVLSCSGSCFNCVSRNGQNAHACGERLPDGSFLFTGVVAIGNHG